MRINKLEGWKHIKDEKPFPAMSIQIQYRGKILDCLSAETTVYNPSNNKILRYDQFEIWKFKEETRQP